jgi:hypothetical protein
MSWRDIHVARASAIVSTLIAHSKTACNEKGPRKGFGAATKEASQFKSLVETHPMRGLVFLSMLDEGRVIPRPKI